MKTTGTRAWKGLLNYHIRWVGFACYWPFVAMTRNMFFNIRMFKGFCHQGSPQQYSKYFIWTCIVFSCKFVRWDDETPGPGCYFLSYLSPGLEFPSRDVQELLLFLLFVGRRSGVGLVWQGNWSTQQRPISELRFWISEGLPRAEPWSEGVEFPGLWGISRKVWVNES